MPRFDGRFFPSSTVTDWAAGKFGAPGWYPNEPTGVTVTEEDQQATLEWTPGRSNGLDITGYKIEKNSGSWSTAVANTASTAGSRVVTGLTNGTTYTFRIKAINSLGESEVYSSVPAGKTPRGTPLVPGTLSLAAGATPTTMINLSWSAGATNGATITGYSVQQSADGLSWSSVTANTGNTSTAYTVTGLIHTTQYYFKVAAVNVAGIGTYSNEPTLTTGAAISATGGTITTSGSYKIHTFTSTGTFVVTTGGSDVELLLVSGGGSGGCYSHPWGVTGVAGGGGGGGCVNEYDGSETLTIANSTNYAVTVGAGYAAGASGGHGGGEAKFIGGSIDYRTGKSGGGKSDGGGYDPTVASGGTAPHESTGGGGGNGCYFFYTPYGPLMSYPKFSNAGGVAGTNSVNSGCDGGADGGGNGGKWSRYSDSEGYNPMAAGGGGGGGPSGANGGNGRALTSGDNNASNYGGAGGDGTASSFSGVSVVYGGGGGGDCGTTSGNEAAGGSGGGGQGGMNNTNDSSPDATAGAANTGGGGGGGGGGNTASSKSGGSGIVIIRYLV